MTKIEARHVAASALEALQEFTKQDFPLGKEVKARRGKGLATFKVAGYPEPISLDAANAVIGENLKTGKAQMVSLGSLE